jgi:hypothetical protein
MRSRFFAICTYSGLISIRIEERPRFPIRHLSDASRTHRRGRAPSPGARHSTVFCGRRRVAARQSRVRDPADSSRPPISCTARIGIVDAPLLVSISDRSDGAGAGAPARHPRIPRRIPPVPPGYHDLAPSVRGEVSEPGERHDERIRADIEYQRVGVEIQPRLAHRDECHRYRLLNASHRDGVIISTSSARGSPRPYRTGRGSPTRCASPTRLRGLCRRSAPNSAGGASRRTLVRDA